MKKLTDKQFWDSQYKTELSGQKQKGLKLSLIHLLKRCLGSKIVEFSKCYEHYVLWEGIYKKYIPKIKNAKLLEVGSAPGNKLVEFHRIFDFIPYGVEYSQSGVELNKKTFIVNGIDPNNVIHSDFFSALFQRDYREYFDIVISSGFIEHFTDVYDVIEKHLNLLKPGGYLIINIPNVMGFSYILTRLFAREQILKHNLSIMQERTFSRLFPKEKLIHLFCGYTGTFNITLPNCLIQGESRIAQVLKISHKVLMNILNFLLRLLFKDKGAESRMFSTNLTFIGIKK